MLTKLPASVCANGRTVYVDSRIASQVVAVCGQFGVQAYSGRRFEPGSDHNCGAAVDFTGSDTNQRALYDYAKGVGTWWVEPWNMSHTIGAAGTTGPHVHISFFRCGARAKVSPKTSPTGSFTLTDYRNAWETAGGSKALSPIMAAIGMAESHGDPRAHCLNCAGVREDSRGLWQINIDANPEFSSWNLYDPVTNATAARTILKRQGLAAWSTYKSGAYKPYLSSGGGSKPGKSIPGILTGIAGDAASGLPGLGIGVAKGGLDLLGIGIPNPVSGVESAVTKGFTWLGMSILYSVIIMGGVSMVLVGMVMIGIDIGFVRHSATVNAFTSIPRPGYNPSKANTKAYRVGVARGEQAKARAQGYREGREGATVAMRSRVGKTPKAVGTKALADAARKKDADKFGKVPY